MKIVDLLNASEKTRFSFELLPPLKGNDINTIYMTIDPLLEFNPAYINITYHQEEIIYKKHSSGLLEKKTVRKRPGTVAISAAIKYRFKDVLVVPHIICGGFTKEETENALIDLEFLGINNILVVRGDPEKSQKVFTPEPDGHKHSVDLLKQIISMNQGKYLDEELLNSTPTDFSVGVAGYPEKHCEAPNMNTDLFFLKQKINAGAEFIVTQMFFDNKKYFDFVAKCREIGINVPIIPGIKPLSVRSQISALPFTFHIDVPEDLVKEVIKCKDNEAVRQVGVEWTIAQSKELIKSGAPAVHYFTMGKPDNIQKIAKEVF
ncbi:MAG: methylenetetrahydrofolate reductase [NAD(P)H] [Bacteroidetes bacterium RIFOXYA12_FULL_35_11]|nr:MAG: methylenetetrahydrofolate reductase [NAD(P)H] [Bacteroidetes bacterium GWF2_35_48]OFY77743.1 MAG: methylenetetrahydrofolate reductase [NAD(P)H] [Bacteroidetes bacterium RIFOXYA12_FULL_35_11]OFY97906.1 MAG: methylenetetrahydrofolate reductase [NAD(P)H] [Bacteroidetes bacterium RIFOXYB2_FULL_35_7]OFY98405.1 MAG: methylenetetrahydrofolate reductase [NAD(P)H] [Bacteroidetes bacterium RIFOXYC12_FULL_35_7]HBX51908.1 methylenetetrahydrofolate reductase [NAD(P)H] [Bacteroidales bacterium]